MYKFPITNYREFSDLPLDTLDRLRFSVYILDFEWKFLFLNDFARTYLNKDKKDLVGEVIWDAYPTLLNLPAFRQLKKSAENGAVIRVQTLSPLTSKRLSLTNYKLDDCYYLAASILPDKAQLLDELRDELTRRNLSAQK